MLSVVLLVLPTDYIGSCLRRSVNCAFSLVGSFGLWDLLSLFKEKLDTTKFNKAHVGSVLALD